MNRLLLLLVLPLALAGCRKQEMIPQVLVMDKGLRAASETPSIDHPLTEPAIGIPFGPPIEKIGGSFFNPILSLTGPSPRGASLAKVSLDANRQIKLYRGMNMAAEKNELIGTFEVAGVETAAAAELELGLRVDESEQVFLWVRDTRTRRYLTVQRKS